MTFDALDLFAAFNLGVCIGFAVLSLVNRKCFCCEVVLDPDDQK